MDWKPIETAPKAEDMQGNMLGSDGYMSGEVFWHDGSECYGRRGKAGWFWESDRGSLLTARNAYITFWMPLPEPPPPIPLR